eukprot:gnl/MRDRNA2_/MRDRNA2_185292_c0_seq1.p1 gnl/MRDRNA2_/MRDRNA2_185292_c0~~gnl/MRDRNA2_/MRDRNA2_185292_c0_seq1.p1  ORF type:complete len:523 (-),score=77.34 gnl/MRDRNA2_/MRDRNA2_185292_c0_seq1:403-1896(-)
MMSKSLWIKMLPRAFCYTILVVNCPAWVRPFEIINGVLTVAGCALQHLTVTAFIGNQKTLNQALQKNNALLNGVFDAVFTVDVQGEQVMIVSSSEQLDQIFEQQMQGRFLDKSMIYGQEQFANLFRQECFQEGKKRVQRALVTCINENGFEFDCEFRTVQTGVAGETEGRLLGITLVGEKRPTANASNAVPSASTSSALPQTKSESSYSDSRKSQNAGEAADSESLFSFFSLSTLITRLLPIQNQIPEHNISSVKYIPRFMSLALSSLCDIFLECRQVERHLQVSAAAPRAELLLGTDLDGWPIEAIIKGEQRSHYRAELDAFLEDAASSEPHPQGFAIRHFGEFSCDTLLLGGSTVNMQFIAFSLPSLDLDATATVFLCLTAPVAGHPCASAAQPNQKISMHQAASIERSEVIGPYDSVSCAGNEKDTMSLRRRIGTSAMSDAMSIGEGEIAPQGTRDAPAASTSVISMPKAHAKAPAFTGSTVSTGNSQQQLLTL